MSDEQSRPSPNAYEESWRERFDDMAMKVAIYFEALRQRGVPDVLAAELVRDWHAAGVARHSLKP